MDELSSTLNEAVTTSTETDLTRPPRSQSCQPGFNVNDTVNTNANDSLPIVSVTQALDTTGRQRSHDRTPRSRSRKILVPSQMVSTTLPTVLDRNVIIDAPQQLQVRTDIQDITTDNRPDIMSVNVTHADT